MVAIGFIGIGTMGREMAKIVLSMSAVRGQSPRQMILNPELALRESTVGSLNGKRPRTCSRTKE